MEFVARAVEVCRNEVRKFLAVLNRIHLCMNEVSFLCDSVWSIGLFRITVPQRFFFEWNRSELRVRADSAEQDSFFCTSSSSGFDDVCSHHEVVEIQRRWRNLVVSDTADAGS